MFWGRVYVKCIIICHLKLFIERTNIYDCKVRSTPLVLRERGVMACISKSHKERKWYISKKKSNIIFFKKYIHFLSVPVL